MDNKERHLPFTPLDREKANAVIENKCILLLDVDTHDLSCAWRGDTEADVRDV
jgi:hypothetical protein